MANTLNQFQIKHKTNQVIQSQFRSEFTKYNRELANYGLFGMENWKTSKKAFQKSIDNQLGYRSDVNRYKSLATLDQNEELTKQIVDEMKWRAPIDWSLLVVDKVKGSGALKTIKKGEKSANTQFNNKKKISAITQQLNVIHFELNAIYSESGILDKLIQDGLQDIKRAKKTSEIKDMIMNWGKLSIKNNGREILVSIFLGQLNREVKQLLIAIGNTNDPTINQIKSYLSNLFVQISVCEALWKGLIKKNKLSLTVIALLKTSLSKLQQQRKAIVREHQIFYSWYNLQLQVQKSKEAFITKSIMAQIKQFKNILYTCPNPDRSVKSPKMNSNLLLKNAIHHSNQIISNSGYVKNKIAVSEYVLNKFTYRTFNSSNEKAFRMLHVDPNSEVEKMIYPSKSCEVSQSFVTLEILTLRLGIQFAYVLFKNGVQVATLNWTIYLKLFLEALVRAINDVKQLVQNKSVSFIPVKQSFQTTYIDYLRLMVYSQKSTSNLLVQIKKIIERNTDVRLEQVTTQASMEVKIDRTSRAIFTKRVKLHEIYKAKFAY